MQWILLYFQKTNYYLFFARGNYDYKNRYLLTATIRADGSSKFSSSNRWGYFPSAAAAWKLSKEDFLKDVSWINELKMRYSYGHAGNNNIPTGQTVQIFVPGTSAWINNVSNFYAAPKIQANPNLKWETTVTQNVGLDFELFKSRITGSVEIYKNITTDLLLKFPTPGTGYDFQYRNLGQVQNTGLEASLNLIAIDKKDYGLSFAFNIGMNKNRVNDLGSLVNYQAATNWASTAIGNDFSVNPGGQIGEMFGYVGSGRYEVSDFDFSGGVYTLKPGVPDNQAVTGSLPVPGAMKLRDINGDEL